MSEWGIPTYLTGGVSIYRSENPSYAAGVATYKPDTSWRKALIEDQLRDIEVLDENWDSYGGAKVEKNAIISARYSLNVLSEFPKYLMPSTAGTLLFEWESPLGRACLEFGQQTFSFYASPKIGDTIFLSGNLREMHAEKINDALATAMGDHKPKFVELVYQDNRLESRDKISTYISRR
jgi:hypothetical protein